MTSTSLFFALPPEILGHIAQYLSGEHVVRLKLTGSKFLWQKLSAKSALKRVTMPFKEIRFARAPAFLNELAGLEELRFYWKSDPYTRSVRVRWCDLPKELRKLVFKPKKSSKNLPDDFKEAFFLNEDGSPVNVRAIMPKLEELQIHIDWVESKPWMTKLPPTLKNLHLGTWNPMISLPPKLTTFSCSHTSFIYGNAKSFPRTLTHLEVRDRIQRMPTFLSALPATLTHLSTNIESRGEISVREIAKLPRGIQYLQFSFGSIIPAPVSANDLAAAWPPALEHLFVSHFPTSLWSSLPRQLLSFHELVPDTSILPKVDLLESELEEKWSSLPSSLTDLKLQTWHHLMPRRFLWKFPHMVSLDLSTSYFLLTEPSDYENLFSPSLKSLKLLNLDETMAKYLPKGLRHLEALEAFPNPKLLPSLPAALSSLSLSFVSKYSHVYHPETRTISSFDIIRPLLPSYSEALLWCPTNSKTGSVLPLYLRDLNIRHQNLTHGQVPKNFEKMAFLAKILIRYACGFTDLSMPALSQHPITTLKIVAEKAKLTSECFKVLPRSLTVLQISATEALWDHHVSDLPRELLRITLPNAIHLTKACLPLLPPRLNTFSSDQNQTFQIEDIPLLPFKFQPQCEPAYPHFFDNRNFRVYCGTVMEL